MLFERSKPIVATLATMLFSAVLLLPCFCSTAVAADYDSTAGDESDCCPTSEATDTEDEQPGDESDDCCCDSGLSTCTSSGADDPFIGQQALTSSFEQDDADGFSSWWTPDLVATLWLVDRLADGVAPCADPPDRSDDLRPDRSDTYLQNATLLL